MIPRAWLLGFMAAALVASHTFAWMQGGAWKQSACERAQAAAVAERDALEARLRGAELTLEIWRTDQATRAMEAENAAMADPGTRVPSDASRLRLERRWSDPAP